MISDTENNGKVIHPRVSRLSQDPRNLVTILTNARKTRDHLGILLIEHAQSELDADDPTRGIRKVRKGGVTPLMVAFSKMLFDRKGLSAAQVLQMLDEGHPDVEHIGLDPCLSDTGIEQSQKLGTVIESLRQNGLVTPANARRDRIPYTSELTRPKETAGYAGLGWSPHELESLNERYMFAGHGLTTARFLDRFPELRESFTSGQNLMHPKIEDEGVFYRRVENALRTILFENAHLLGEQTWVPVVTHQTVIKAAIDILLRDSSVNPYTDIDIENTSVTPILLHKNMKKGARGSVVTVNHHQHL